MRAFTKTAISAIAAIAALGTAGAASAQSYPGHGPDRDGFHGTPARADAIRSQIADLEQRVNRNDNRGHVSNREAAGLRREVREIRDQFRAFNRNGIDNREFRVLQDRIERARAHLQVERHDRNDHRDGAPARRW